MKPSKKLQAEWNKKLRKSGLVDIEAPSAKRTHSPLSTWYFESNWSNAAFRDQERYYQLTGRHLNTFKFESIKDKTVWRLHSEGQSLREIEDRTGIPRSTVSDLILRIRKSIKIE